MISIDVSVLDAAVDRLAATLKDSLLACDIWDVDTGLSLAGHNQQPTAVALFNEMTKRMNSTLEQSGWPNVDSSFLLELEGGRIVQVLLFGGGIMGGMLVDAAKVNLGILVNVAVPRMFQDIVPAIDEARARSRG